MRLRIAKILLTICALTGAGMSHAQIVTSNPLEYAALAEGNEMINGEVKKQIENQTKTAVIQNTIAAEFAKIHEWESKYNGYLKTVEGYASSLKASATLYNEGFRIFLTLGKLYNAVKSNPQGVVATISLNNLYMETATEMISVYTLLKNAVASGDKVNMLNGTERSQLLWELNDKLASFHKKLKQLALSVKYYTLADVWNNITAGMIDRNQGEIARAAHGRWIRAAKVIR